ncbi:MAG: HD domain-containing protein [Phycisphaeraceae bacterium]|nr:HD domain-containing protein [Phycisphaeraceae bacterium]
MDRLEQQVRFILEIDKLKQVFRRSLITDGSRRENDAEHSWHFAVMIAVFGEYAPESVDLLRVLKIALIHDIVEIDAGDVNIYDQAGRQQAVEHEKKAAQRIFSLLPDDQAGEYRALWEEFETRKTPEAKFARVFDRLQPFLLNYATRGMYWKEHHVTFDQVMKLNRPIVEAGAPALVPFFERLLFDAREKKYFGDASASGSKDPP